MSKDVEIKETIEELDILMKAAEEAIKKYNKLSKKINFETRLGLATSDASFVEDLKENNEEKPNDLDEWLEENGNYENTYVGIDGLGSDAWFPSSIGC